MINQEKKVGDLDGSFVLLNQLISSMEEAELKFEEACKKDNVEQINLLKDFMLKIQKQIAGEIK
ncbi:MAG: hypothetical protein ACP5NZ_04225 [Nanobdellota archaeon]